MDDRSWNEYLLGNAGIKTGAMWNEIGLKTAPRLAPVSTPVTPSAPATGTTSGRVFSNVRPATPRSMTEAERRRLELAQIRQQRLDALPSAAVFRKWKHRFACLNTAAFATKGILAWIAVLDIIVALLALAAWPESIIARNFGIAIGVSLILFAGAFYVEYAAMMLEAWAPSAIRTWAGLADFGPWIAPFQAVHAFLQSVWLLVLLLWPIAALFVIVVWFQIW